jgi:DNA topoisomerase-3
VAELITKRVIGPLSGFRSRQGKPFSAVMRLTDDFRVEFDFGQGSGEGEEAPDFSGQEPLGACPKCGSRVYEHGMAYTCEKAVGPAKSCDFRSGRLILQQPIEREQMKKLLATGRTDLLTGFVSKKGRRFKAFLVKNPDGKIGFEFQPRKEKAAAGKEKPADAKVSATEEKPVKKAAKKRRAA